MMDTSQIKHTNILPKDNMEERKKICTAMWKIKFKSGKTKKRPSQPKNNLKQKGEVRKLKIVLKKMDLTNNKRLKVVLKRLEFNKQFNCSNVITTLKNSQNDATQSLDSMKRSTNNLESKVINKKLTLTNKDYCCAHLKILLTDCQRQKKENSSIQNGAPKGLKT